MALKLNESCAVVTGGAKGIGLATTKRLLAEGCKVTIWDIDGKAIDDVIAGLNSSGKLFGDVVDVTDKEIVYSAAARAIEQMGQVDILVNNAGYVMGGDFLDQPDEIWEKTIDINLTSFIYTTRAFLPGMYERNRGHIINISSAAGGLGVPGLSVYAATKWAVWGLTESLRFEAINAGKKGVRYSSIHPSYIKTGLFEGARIPFPGSLLVPLVENHDVIAKAIVESAIKKGRYSPKRPVTVNLTARTRALLPDFLFQKVLMLLKIPQSMKTWHGRR
ncbi:MAG: SDR family NAD(P)-dependent oxidoreductase [Ignavibacteriaceae bacterium]|nr:SDR family NAD(P)-dependent oxidoreductase [Ignavibacteriaceae bacterium]